MNSIFVVHGGKGREAFAPKASGSLKGRPTPKQGLSVGDGSPAKKRVVLADAHPLFRYGLKHFLDEQPDLVCSGEAGTAKSLLELLPLIAPDLLVMGLRYPDCDGVALIKALRAQYATLRILISSASDESVYAERGFRAGAVGFIGKEESPTQFLCAVRCVLGGEPYFSRKISILFLERAMGRQTYQRSGDFGVLSNRELCIFELLGTGLSSRKVAMQLGISLKTVESHRENIKHKLGLSDSAELVHRAVEFVQH